MFSKGNPIVSLSAMNAPSNGWYRAFAAGAPLELLSP